MVDNPEFQMTPDTPGGPAIRNPFDSPNDYHRLHESLVPSPSVFRSCTTSGATPAKFNWSIEEMASLLPVHIDPEDIHRQSLFFSQSRMDTEIEAKRQNAIEQFFTKGSIVPSPWTASANKQSAKINVGLSSMSPLVFEEPPPLKKTNAACQTTLSLPVDFDLEKILGEQYRWEEACDQVQESLSTSSLRRKLFLDGHGSGSDSSGPPSPERGPGPEERPPGGGCSISSPLSGGIAALTPSTGQFSSSPIQGGRRAHSLGSAASPSLPERSSPATFQSPTLSPIGPQASHTPVGTGDRKGLSGDRKRLSFLTPDGAPLDMDVNSNTESPYVEGCSPIRSCSPLSQDLPRPRPRLRTRCWASPPLVSPILNPQSHQDEPRPPPPSSPLPPMELDPPPSPGAAPRLGGLFAGMGRRAEGPGVLEPVQMEEEEEEGQQAGAEEEEEEEGAVIPVRLTSSRMGSVSAVETSHMFASLLAEGSCIPADSSSMQVDSGYNTYSVDAASLIDAHTVTAWSPSTHTCLTRPFILATAKPRPPEA